MRFSDLKFGRRPTGAQRVHVIDDSQPAQTACGKLLKNGHDVVADPDCRQLCAYCLRELPNLVD